MIEVRYQARLGNNLFQYSLGRILAEGLGFELCAEAIPGFPATRDRVRGARHEHPVQVLSGQRVDLAAILADRTPRRIVLEGWFQRHEYYRPHRDRVRQWLAFDPSIRVPEEPAACVVHVRRLDYVTAGWAMPYSFYEDALRVLGPVPDVWIVTDDERDPFFLRFRRVLRFYRGNNLESLAMMTRARAIVMSQSTYSWWPTFLGDPGRVVCPVPAFGGWSPSGEASAASLIERDRFTCLDVAEPDRPTRQERRHQEERALKRRAILGLNRRFGIGFPEPPQ